MKKFLNSSIIKSSYCSSVNPSGRRYSYGNGALYTSGAKGPNPNLYGFTLLVIVIVINVRPWKPLENAIIPGLFVYLRAIFTAFSTASAPLFKNRTCLSKLPGANAASFSANSIYGSYIMTLNPV